MPFATKRAASSDASDHKRLRADTIRLNVGGRLFETAPEVEFAIQQALSRWDKFAGQELDPTLYEEAALQGMGRLTLVDHNGRRQGQSRKRLGPRV